MLFSSFEFFLFFSITLFVYYKLGSYKKLYATSFLVLASLFFYGWWKLDYLIILILSIIANFFLAKKIRITNSKPLLTLGVLGNLISLCYYKYAGFLATNVNLLFDLEFSVPSILLPLAISFFTFQQIAYLVDTYKDPTFKYDFVNYSLFVTFFPQLIAGPIVHHSEMMPQFSQQSLIQVNWRNIQTGCVYFALGLFKKIVIADTLALTANPVFNAADAGTNLTTVDSWLGALAYSFQLYFDFSGYADMAIGLALMFNIVLPINFNSPYKAQNIIEFWRRWHMTLSRFLRDYLYIALGGSRKGQFNRYRNLLLTMLLGGLWHGAGWNFVIWGALHGSYLCINHGWNYLSSKWKVLNILMTPIAAHIVTFIAVVVAWVFFRAISFEGALSMLSSMTMLTNADSSLFTLSQLNKSILWIVVAAVMAFFLPNVAQLTQSKSTYLTSYAKLSFLIGIYVMWVLLINQQTQEFIYFNF